MNHENQSRVSKSRRPESSRDLSSNPPVSGGKSSLFKFSLSGKMAERLRIFLGALGAAVFLVLYFFPFTSGSTESSALTQEGRGAIGILIMAVIWWTAEVVPIGITALAVGVIEAIFAIRPGTLVYKDYMDPSIMFIFGSIVLGLALTKSGLIKRVMYKVVSKTGGNSALTLLGCMAATAGLAHFMPHTAAAAFVFPILIGVNGFYGEGSRPNNFGKSLFMGMAFAAGTGSIATMLGSARTPATLAMFREFTGNGISFYDLSKYMAPLSWLMLFIIWGYLVLVLRTDRKEIDGLKEYAGEMCKGLGSFTRDELIVIVFSLCVTGAMLLQPFIPGLKSVDRTGILLLSSVLLFVLKVLTVRDLEDVPWNIILLYGGTISLSFCMWQTGAARWMGLNSSCLSDRFTGASSYSLRLSPCCF